MEHATIKDVARVANVSIASASRAINGVGRISPQTKEKVLKAAQDLNYIPHFGARSLINRKTDIFGVLLPEINGAFFSELVHSIDKAAHKKGYQILISSYHHDINETKAAAASMRGRVDGLIIMSPYYIGEELNSQTIGAPIVEITSLNSLHENSLIAIDNCEGAKIATKHLIEQGYKKIAHIAGTKENIEAQDRLNGYLEALAQGNCSKDVGENSSYEAKIYQGDFKEDCGIKLAPIIAQDIKDGVVDAAFVANDLMAIGLMHGLKAEGIEIPKDFGIIGFDNLPFAAYVSPSLSSLGVDIAQMGDKAVEILNHLVNPSSNASDEQSAISPKITVFAPQLSVRASSIHK